MNCDYSLEVDLYLINYCYLCNKAFAIKLIYILMSKGVFLGFLSKSLQFIDFPMMKIVVASIVILTKTATLSPHWSLFI